MGGDTEKIEREEKISEKIPANIGDEREEEAGESEGAGNKSTSLLHLSILSDVTNESSQIGNISPDSFHCHLIMMTWALLPNIWKCGNCLAFSRMGEGKGCRGEGGEEKGKREEGGVSVFYHLFFEILDFLIDRSDGIFPSTLSRPSAFPLPSRPLSSNTSSFHNSGDIIANLMDILSDFPLLDLKISTFTFGSDIENVSFRWLSSLSSLLSLLLSFSSFSPPPPYLSHSPLQLCKGLFHFHSDFFEKLLLDPIGFVGSMSAFDDDVTISFLRSCIEISRYFQRNENVWGIERDEVGRMEKGVGESEEMNGCKNGKVKGGEEEGERTFNWNGVDRKAWMSSDVRLLRGLLKSYVCHLWNCFRSLSENPLFFLALCYKFRCFLTFLCPFFSSSLQLSPLFLFSSYLSSLSFDPQMISELLIDPSSSSSPRFLSFLSLFLQSLSECGWVEMKECLYIVQLCSISESPVIFLKSGFYSSDLIMEEIDSERGKEKRNGRVREEKEEKERKRERERSEEIALRTVMSVRECLQTFSDFLQSTNDERLMPLHCAFT